MPPATRRASPSRYRAREPRGSTSARPFVLDRHHQALDLLARRSRIGAYVLCQMLGVRRASVSDTLGDLQRRGIIRTTRSLVAITDRPALERVACECYGIISAARERMLEGRPTRSVLHDVDISRDGVSTAGDGTPVSADPE